MFYLSLPAWSRLSLLVCNNSSFYNLNISPLSLSLSILLRIWFFWYSFARIILSTVYRFWSRFWFNSTYCSCKSLIRYSEVSRILRSFSSRVQVIFWVRCICFSTFWCSTFLIYSSFYCASCRFISRSLTFCCSSCSLLVSDSAYLLIHSCLRAYSILSFYVATVVIFSALSSAYYPL